MTSKLKTIGVLTFMLFLFSVSTFACTCTYDGIKVKGFRGQVFAAYKEDPPNFKEPLPNATLKLLKETDDENQVIAEVVADENGRFSLENIKSGKYLLNVEATMFDGIFVSIKIAKSSSRKKDEIFISLGPSESCCQGVTQVRKAK